MIVQSSMKIRQMTVDFYKTDIKIEGMKVFIFFLLIVAQNSNFELINFITKFN